MAALTGATLLSLAGAAEEKETIKRMPWNVVLMVCGVTVLIGVLERTQGMDAVHRSARAHLDALDRHGRHRVCDRAGVGVQQHVRRRATGVSANGSRAWWSASAAATRSGSRRR